MNFQGNSKLVLCVLLAGAFIASVVAERWWGTKPAPVAVAPTQPTATAKKTIRAPEAPADIRIVEEALDKVRLMFETAPVQERASAAGLVLSRLSASDLREIAARIITSTNLARLGTPDTTLEEVLFERLGSEFGEGFARELGTIPESERGRRRLAQTSAINGWLASNPDGALDYFKQQPLGELGSPLAGRLASVWYEKDPVGLVAFLNNMPANQEGLATKELLLRAWATKEPATAFNWIWGHMVGGSPEPTLVKSVLKAWLATAPADAVARLTAIHDERKFSGVLATLCRGLAPDEQSAVMRELVKQPKGGLDEIFAAQGSFLGVNPEALLAFAERFPNNDHRGDLMTAQAIQQLADTDLTGAIEAARRHQRTSGFDLTTGIIQRWALKDPESCLRFIKSETVGNQQISAYMGFASALARKDPLSAIEAAGQAPESARAAMLSTVAANTSPNEVPRLIAWLREQPESALTAQVVGSVTSSLAMRDIKAADELVSTLPPGPSREQAFRSMAVIRASRDGPAAEKWLQELNNPADRAAAVPGFVSRIAYDNPESALRWALTIPNIEQNPEVFERAAKIWLQQHPDKAQEFFQKNAIPESLRQRVLPKP